MSDCGCHLQPSQDPAQRHTLWIALVLNAAMAVIGFVAGVMQEVESQRNAVGAVFSILMVLWGVAWIRKWQRSENRFSVRWGQDVEAQQELVRDEFVYDRLALSIARSEKAKQIRFGDSLVNLVGVRSGAGAFGDSSEPEHYVLHGNAPEPVKRRKHHF